MSLQKYIDTDVARLIEATGAAAEKLKFQALPAKKTDKKEEQKAGDKADHASDQLPDLAILGKVPGYAQRGHDFLVKNAPSVKRDLSPSEVYADFNRDYVKKIADVLDKRAKFPGGSAANFNPGAASATMGQKANQRFPYTWEGHHIIPASAFYLTDDNDRPAFTDEECDLLMKTPYDVNHGHNIIMLPKLAWGAPVHGLLQHPSDHPEYTKRVIRELQQVAKALQSYIKKKPPKDHKAIVAKLFEKLKMVEDKCWNLLVDLGRASVEAACVGKELDHPDSEHVLYQALTRPTDYAFGRLY